MLCIKLLIFAPVYLEHVDSLDKDQNVDSLVISLQNHSVSASEIAIEKSALDKVDLPATRASRISKSDPLSSLPSNLDRNYLNFPFLIDNETFRYISKRDTKTMFIMRGLSGSGKSSIVSIIKSAFKNVIVCSADDYFYKSDESYEFNEKLLGAAHETCHQKATEACSKQVPIVVIDNTNVKRWELRFYAELANKNGYVAVLVQPKTPWRWSADELATRSRHGISVEVLQRKITMFDDVIPLYYGWFINKNHSGQLAKLCLKSFVECLSKFPDLRRDLLKALKVQTGVSDEEITRVLSMYSASSSSPLLHCTAKFCARGKLTESKDYHKRADIQQACGKMFVLQISGLVLTRRSIGARVSLVPSDSPLFDRPEEEEWESKASASRQTLRSAAEVDKIMDSLEEYYEMVEKGNRKVKKNVAKFLKKQQRKQKNALKNSKQVDSDSAMGRNGKACIQDSQVSQLDNDSMTERNEGNSIGESQMSQQELATVGSRTNTADEEFISLSELFPHLNYSNKTRSAHFTIRTAKGVEAQEVNYDILHACDVEAATNYTKSSFVSVSRGQACYYGDCLCCVYFNKPLLVQTLFSGFY